MTPYPVVFWIWVALRAPFLPMVYGPLAAKEAQIQNPKGECVMITQLHTWQDFSTGRAAQAHEFAPPSEHTMKSYQACNHGMLDHQNKSFETFQSAASKQKRFSSVLLLLHFLRRWEISYTSCSISPSPLSPSLFGGFRIWRPNRMGRGVKKYPNFADK